MALLAARAAWIDPTREARSLWRRPGYALLVILTLALGIGAVTTVYALVQGVLLNALPYPQADRLMLVRNQNAQTSWNTSVVDFRAVAESGTTFESVAAMRTASALIGRGEDASWANARWVTAGFFDVMGVRPARGRAFAAGDDQPGAVPAVVISDSFAQRRFAGRDPIGQRVEIDTQSHVVVGVMPAGVEQWAVMRADLWPVMQLAAPERRGPFFLATLVRLKPDVTPAQAAADLEGLSRRLFPQWQTGAPDETARLAPQSLHSVVTGGVGGFLWLAMAAVAVVMLIALLNTSNLVLMRAAQRGADLSVRAALGASRWRLARLLMSENLQLVALGALGGLALAATLLSAYRALGPVLPRLTEVSLSPGVLGFVGAVVLATAIVLAALPLLFGTLGDSTSMQPTRASAGKRQQRLRDALVVLELALALPLLIAAGLLVDSLVRLQRVDPGFEPAQLLTTTVRLPESRYVDAPARLAFWDRALPELRHLPGVEGVALMGALPPNCGCYNNFELIGRPTAQGMQPQAPWIPVDAGFFATTGVRPLEGRVFDTRDTPDSTRVLVVSESWARRYFPNEPAVGKTLYEGGDTEQPATVIGVVSDVKFDGLQSAGDAVFAPTSQGWGGSEMYLVLRTAAEPLSIAASMRGALQRLDPGLVPTAIEPMANLLSDSLGGQRHWAVVIAAFAIAALLLSAVGVFAVLGYHVAQRQREIGIRQALGADAHNIVRLVLRRGLACALLGAVLGSLLAQFATSSLGALLYEVTPTDPRTWLFAWALLLLVAFAACWVPARRAARVDPLHALRQE